MSGIVKNAVRNYIQKRERTPYVKRTKSFSRTATGSNCIITIELEGHLYAGTGWGGSKRNAEHEAYGEILCSMILDGHEIQGCETFLADMYGEKAAQVRSMLSIAPGKAAWISPQIRHAVTRLRNDRSQNPIGPLSEFANAVCGARTVRLDVKTVRNSTPLQYCTTAILKLPCGERLQTVASMSLSKLESKQEAATALTEQILAHYDYVP